MPSEDSSRKYVSSATVRKKGSYLHPSMVQHALPPETPPTPPAAKKWGGGFGWGGFIGKQKGRAGGKGPVSWGPAIIVAGLLGMDRASPLAVPSAGLESREMP